MTDSGEGPSGAFQSCSHASETGSLNVLVRTDSAIDQFGGHSDVDVGESAFWQNDQLHVYQSGVWYAVSVSFVGTGYDEQATIDLARAIAAKLASG